MSEETKESNTKVEETPKTNPQENTNTNNDNDNIDFNALIAEVEKDLNDQKKKVYEATKLKYEKDSQVKSEEIESLKKQIATIEEKSKAETQKIIEAYKAEMKAKVDSIEKELSSRKSVIADQKNPFRNADGKPDEDWWKRKDISEEEKFKYFAKHTLGK